MDLRYEYVWVECGSLELNKLGNEGWRVVPGIFREADRASRSAVLMEKIKQPPETAKLMADNTEITEIEVEEEPELCGAKRAAGWGGPLVTCSFPKHGPEKVHSWVVT